jgi:spermidine/putrescine transport system substrate-binding protein
MNRRYFLMGASSLVGCTRDRRPRLNVFNWSAYIAPETVPNFEREFGCRVRYGIYESNEEMMARVMSGNSGWDIVFPTTYMIKPMQAQGLLTPDPPVLYMSGAAGIAFNRKLVAAPEAWADLWHDRLHGRITMLDDPFDVMGACLKKLGYSVNASDPNQLKAAQQEAIRQKPLVRAYLNAEVRDQLVSGDVLIAQMWNTVAQQAMDVSQDIGFVYPREGYAVYEDCMVILRESRRRELASEFVKYMQRPSVAAANAFAARTTTANPAAVPLLPQNFRNNPTLYPEPDVQARGELAQTLSPENQRLRDRLWTEIKSS